MTLEEALEFSEACVALGDAGCFLLVALGASLMPPLPPLALTAHETTILNCLECQKPPRKGVKPPRKCSLATNCQANSLKDRRQGKLISLVVLALELLVAAELLSI